MVFPQIVYYKRNLVFMKNFYHRIVVVSVSTVLGFSLSSHEKAKAATLTLAPTIHFNVVNYSEGRYSEDIDDYLFEFDEEGDIVIIDELSSAFGKEGIRRDTVYESRLFIEFNIDTFSFVPNENINRVILQSYFSFVG